MGVRIASSGNNTIQNASLTNGVEIICAQVGPIGLVQDNAQITLMWSFAASLGVGATSVQIRLRRGTTITSTLVNVALNYNAVASVVNVFGGAYVDTPGVVSGLQYVLTALVGGGAANGTLNDVSLSAIVL